MNPLAQSLQLLFVGVRISSQLFENRQCLAITLGRGSWACSLGTRSTVVACLPAIAIHPPVRLGSSRHHSDGLSRACRSEKLSSAGLAVGSPHLASRRHSALLSLPSWSSSTPANNRHPCCVRRRTGLRGLDRSRWLYGSMGLWVYGSKRWSWAFL